MDGPVGEAVLTQNGDVIIVYVGRGIGEFFGVGAEGQIRWGERSLPPVGRYQMHELIGFGSVGQVKIVGDLSPEIVGVGASSVEAVVEGGDDGG